MDLTTRPSARAPYEGMGVPSFSLTSDTLADGGTMPASATAEGGSRSPHLAWSGAPSGTRSFMITCFDPDAPVPAGWWHWAVLDLPASASRLEEGAGRSDLELDGPAFHLRGDTGDHRYVFAVHALDVDTLGLDDDATPTMAAFTALGHTMARADLTVTFQA